MTEEEMAIWIASVTGQPVEHLERVGYGASRATYIAKLDVGDDLVVRLDTGDGPMAGTELSLAREAEVYRALDDTSVRIPHLHAVAPDGSALLVDRAAGTHELDVLSEADQLAVYDDFLAALADLHQVDPSTLELPSYRRPTDGPSHALEELDLWGTHPRRSHHAALAAGALHQGGAPPLCARGTSSRTVLCHGDVGPGNFLHDGHRVTALLDWEFSHLGDPMDDLGWWVFRGHDMAGGCGDLRAQLARWSATHGLARRPRQHRVLPRLRHVPLVGLGRVGPRPGRRRHGPLRLLRARAHPVGPAHPGPGRPPRPAAGRAAGATDR